MATPRKIEGTHRSLGRLICDRCGHKTSLDRIGHAVMREHLAAKHPPAATPDGPAKETGQ
jgi:hypothetical protein